MSQARRTASSQPLLTEVSRSNATDCDADPNHGAHSDGGSSSSPPSAREYRSSVWPPARAAVKSEQRTTLPECLIPAPLLPRYSGSIFALAPCPRFQQALSPAEWGITLALGRAKSGRIVGFSVRKKILRLCNAQRRVADHRPPGSAAKGDRNRAAGRSSPLTICLRLSASLSGAQCGEHADEYEQAIPPSGPI
jgi:hypothetical protein